MRSTAMQRLRWVLPLTLFAIFFWRTAYTLRSLTLSILSWAVPVVLLGAWLLAHWRRQQGWPRTTLDRPLLIWLAVTALTTIFSDNLRSSLWANWETFVGILVLWALVDSIRHGWAPVLWRALYLAAAVVCLIGVVELLAWYFGSPLLPIFQQGWPAIGGLADPFPPVLHRLGLAIVNPTALSAFVALLIPPAISVLVSSRDRDVRLGMLLWLIAAGAITFLSLSRGGFLALGVSLPLLLLGATRSPQFGRWRPRLPLGTARILLGAALLVVLVAAVGAGFVLSNRLSYHASGDAVRLDLWRSAIAIFLDRPLAGVGPAAYGTALRSYRTPTLARDQVTTAHNLYLNVAAEMGIAGLLAGAWLLLALVRAWWQRWHEEAVGTPRWWRTLGIGAALAGFAAHSFVDTFVEPAVLLPVTFFVALILAPRRVEAPVTGGHARWPWAAALAVLTLGALGVAWDSRGLAHYMQSLALTRQGKIDEALSLADQARREDPSMPLYACHTAYLHGLRAAESPGMDLESALNLYRACLEGTPVPAWTDQLNVAALLWQAGRPAQAREAARQATAQTPVQWLPWLNRGLWAEMAGDRDEAIRSYHWVLVLDPELAGSPFWRQGERSAWWHDILAPGGQADAHGDEPSLLWQWQVGVAAGDWQETEQEIEAWLEAHPGDAEAMAWLGEALLDQGRPAEALVWLDRALAKEPAKNQSYLVRGEAALALGRYDDAERDLHIALFLEPNYRVHLDLARLAYRTGAEEEALEEYAQAMRPMVYPQDSSRVLYDRLGWPAPLPQVARIGYRQDGEAALEWGALLEQRGEPQTAQQVYTAALRLDQFQEEVRHKLAALAVP